MNFLNDENNQQLAAYLREKRIEQNLNLDDISNKIGIPIQHLKRIEEGDFEEYDSFYLKMYLKKYASSLSLNIDELYQRFYGEEVKQPEVEVNVKKQRTPKKKYPKRDYNIGKIIGLLCAVIIIVLGIIFGVDMVRSMLENNNNGTESGPQITNPHTPDITGDQGEDDQDEQNEKEQVPEEEVEPMTTINKLSHEGNTQTFAVATDAEEIEITLNFTGDCWVGTAAGETINLESGSTMTGAGITFGDGNSENIIVNEDGTLSFNVGNIQTFEMTINGEPVEIERAVASSVQWIVLNMTMEIE